VALYVYQGLSLARQELILVDDLHVLYQLTPIVTSVKPNWPCFFDGGWPFISSTSISTWSLLSDPIFLLALIHRALLAQPELCHLVVDYLSGLVSSTLLLSALVCFCLLLSTIVYSCLLLSALVCSCLLLSALVCSCLHLSPRVCSCLFVPALACFYLPLSALACSCPLRLTLSSALQLSRVCRRPCGALLHSSVSTTVFSPTSEEGHQSNGGLHTINTSAINSSCCCKATPFWTGLRILELCFTSACGSP
jgi:hypothetical protein